MSAEDDLLNSIDVNEDAVSADEAALNAIDVNEEDQLAAIDVNEGESFLDKVPSIKEYADYYGAPFKAFKDEGFSGFADKSLDIAKSAVGSAFSAFEPVLSASDRLAGTTVAYAIDGYQSMLDPTGRKYSFSPLEKAKLRDVDKGYNIVGEVAHPRVLPVSLSQDLLQDPVTEGMLAAGAKLRANGAEETGKVVEGLAGSTGIAAAMIGSYLFDPIGALKLGKLTKQGEALAKSGQLAKGTTRQIVQGERNLIGAEFAGSYKNLLPKKLENKAVLEAQELVAGMEMSRPGQWLRHYTTKPSLIGIGRAGEDYVISNSIIEAEKQKLHQAFLSKAQTAGINIADKESKLDFYRYIENPTTYVPKYVDAAKYDAVYDAMNAELEAAVESARARGVNIAKFEPKMLIGDEITTSERYIPRYGSADSRQKLYAARIAKDSEDAEHVVESLSLAPKGQGKTVLNSALIERSKLNRDQMNALMKDKFGIDEFFHDDPFVAYADKIAEVKKLEETQKLREAVLQSAAKGKGEWTLMKKSALERVAAARAQGLVPDPDDLRLSKLKLNQLTSIDPFAAKQLGKPVKDSTLLFLPKPDADFVNGLFVTPDKKGVQALMNGYMKAWKNSVFFNPGFFGRNGWENWTRSKGLGLSQKDIATAQAEYVFNRGKGLKYVDEFKTVDGATGMLTEFKGTQGAVTAPKELIEGEHAQSRLMRIIHEMAAKGKVGEWLNGLRKLPEKYAENPAFKFAQSVNAKGESSFRYAYFRKLREQGYTVKEAIKEVDSKFISYRITRNKVVSGQTIFPFMNYMIKNAETSMKLLAQRPKSAVLYGPGGSLQRAIENWSGWQPGQTQRLKDLFGHYYSDQFMGHILPNEEKMIEEKDYIKQLMNSWMNSDGKMTGYNLWAKLPSNYHGLLALNPLRADELAGPMVKMGFALSGVDPFTGMPIPDATQVDTGDRLKLAAAWKEASGGFVPDRLINATRQYLQDKWPEHEQKLAGLGFSPQVMELMLGDKSDSQQRRMRKALSVAKTVWMGQATQSDMDIYFRIMADIKQTRSAMSRSMNQAGKTGSENKLDNSIATAERVYDQLIKRVEGMIDIKDEYDRAVIKAGGVPMENLEESEEMLKDKGVQESIGMEAEDTSDVDLEEESLDVQESELEGIDVNQNADEQDRMPAGVLDGPTLGVNSQGNVEATTEGQANPGYSQIWQDWLYNGNKPPVPQGGVSEGGQQQLEQMLSDEYRQSFKDRGNLRAPSEGVFEDPQKMQELEQRKLQLRQQLDETAGMSQEQDRSPAQLRQFNDKPSMGQIPEGGGAAGLALGAALGGLMRQPEVLPGTHNPRGPREEKEYRRQLREVPNKELDNIPPSKYRTEEIERRIRIREYEQTKRGPASEEPGPQRQDSVEERFKRWVNDGMPIDASYINGDADIDLFDKMLQDRRKKKK